MVPVFLVLDIIKHRYQIVKGVIRLERVILVLFVVVLFSLPFIGWQTGPVSSVNLFIYLFFSVIGLLIVLIYIQKKHLPDSKLIKISVLIAFLFSPLIFEILLVFVGQELLLPSGVVLPLTLAMLVTGEEEIAAIPLHYYINPVITFLFTYFILWITTRRYHSYPDRCENWSTVFRDFVDPHKRAAIHVFIVVVVIISQYVIRQFWVARYYLPIPNEIMASEYRVNVPWEYPVVLLVDANCHDPDATSIFFLIKDSADAECYVTSVLNIDNELKLDFEFVDHQFVLRDIEEPKKIYTYHVTNTVAPFSDIDKRLTVRYEFESPPKHIKLVLPAVRIEGVVYELPPIRFEYHEKINFGRRDRLSIAFSKGGEAF